MNDSDPTSKSPRVRRNDWRYAGAWISHHPWLIFSLAIICGLAAIILYNDVPDPSRPDLTYKAMRGAWFFGFVAAYLLFRAGKSLLAPRPPDQQ
jgi:hypothetical protein